MEQGDKIGQDALEETTGRNRMRRWKMEGTECDSREWKEQNGTMGNGRNRMGQREIEGKG